MSLLAYFIGVGFGIAATLLCVWLWPPPWTASKPSAPLQTPLSLPYARWTLSDWQASPDRTAYVASLLRTPLFLDLLGMLANVRANARGPVDATTAAMLLGQRIGHDQIIATLLEAAKSPVASPATLEADYAPENVMRAWEQEDAQ